MEKKLIFKLFLPVCVTFLVSNLLEGARISLKPVSRNFHKHTYNQLKFSFLTVQFQVPDKLLIGF